MSAPLSPKNANKPLTNADTNANTITSSKAPVKKDGYAILQQQQKSPPIQPQSLPAARSASDNTASANGDNQTGSQLKKVSRRSSKPIINWFQRKLASTGRARRASEGHGGRPKLPSFEPPNGHSTDTQNEAPSRRERKGTSASAVDRPKSVAAVPSEVSFRSADAPPVPTLSRKDLDRLKERLNDVPEGDTNAKTETDSNPRSSIAPESMWSPSVAVEADEDASVRPLTGSNPPSPSLSHSSSSYLSDPRTFRSMAASTKPTTLLSIDVGNGMAHIAEAPPAHLAQANRASTQTRYQSPGTQSISFALPNSANYSPVSSTLPEGGPTQAPLHTLHHPRDNPRPSSPPPDDASVLTLASSAFGIPGARIGTGALMDNGTDSNSNLGTATDSTSHFVMGDDFDAEREVNASMRALRSRRSWESEASRWSARIGGTSLAPTTPMGERSLWGSNTAQDQADHDSVSGSTKEAKPRNMDRNNSIPRAIPRALTFDSNASVNGSADRHCSSPLQAQFKPSSPINDDHDDETEDPVETPTTPNVETPLPEEGKKTEYFNSEDVKRPKPVEDGADDARSVMTGADVFFSAPSTPMGFN